MRALSERMRALAAELEAVSRHRDELAAKLESVSRHRDELLEAQRVAEGVRDDAKQDIPSAAPNPKPSNPLPHIISQPLPLLRILPFFPLFCFTLFLRALIALTTALCVILKYSQSLFNKTNAI